MRFFLTPNPGVSFCYPTPDQRNRNNQHRARQSRTREPLCVDCTAANLTEVPYVDPSIVVLLLQDNPGISRLSAGLFPPRPGGQLAVLNLSNTGIETIEEFAFEGLHLLELGLEALAATGVEVRHKAFSGLVVNRDLKMRNTVFNGTMTKDGSFYLLSVDGTLDLSGAKCSGSDGLVISKHTFRESIVGKLDLRGSAIAEVESLGFNLLEVTGDVIMSDNTVPIKVWRRSFYGMTVAGNLVMSRTAFVDDRLPVETFTGLILKGPSNRTLQMSSCGLRVLEANTKDRKERGPFSGALMSMGLEVDLSENKLTTIGTYSLIGVASSATINLRRNNISVYEHGWSSEFVTSSITGSDTRLSTEENPSTCTLVSKDHGGSVANRAAFSGRRAALVEVECNCTAGIAGTGYALCSKVPCTATALQELQDARLHGQYNCGACIDSELIPSGATVNFTCDAGYELSGGDGRDGHQSMTRTCVGGFFSPVADGDVLPSCSQSKCDRGTPASVGCRVCHSRADCKNTTHPWCFKEIEAFCSDPDADSLLPANFVERCSNSTNRTIPGWSPGTLEIARSCQLR